MVASASVTIVGIKETLRELQKIEPALAKQIKADYKKVVATLVADIKSTIQPAPLSGFRRNWTDERGRKIGPWDQQAVIKSIVPKFSNRRRGSLAVFSVVMKSPFGAVADMAGRANDPKTNQGVVMIRALSSKFGKPSRGMWPAYERNKNQIDDELKVIVQIITDAANRRLAR